MTLIPGVRPAEGFDPTKTRVGNISVNGGDGRQLDVNVDGGDNKDLVVGGLVQNFPVEAIQEFNVITDNSHWAGQRSSPRTTPFRSTITTHSEPTKNEYST